MKTTSSWTLVSTTMMKTTMMKINSNDNDNGNDDDEEEREVRGDGGKDGRYDADNCTGSNVKTLTRRQKKKENQMIVKLILTSARMMRIEFETEYKLKLNTGYNQSPSTTF